MVHDKKLMGGVKMNTVKRNWHKWFTVPPGWKSRWYQTISLTLTLAVVVMLAISLYRAGLCQFCEHE